ncbi:MAG: hypothetical protein IPJ79_05245 [Bacteroidetes bacterium]|nr:hypothetical protein [Bacteroidota bacterium]
MKGKPTLLLLLLISCQINAQVSNTEVKSNEVIFWWNETKAQNGIDARIRVKVTYKGGELGDLWEATKVELEEIKFCYYEGNRIPFDEIPASIQSTFKMQYCDIAIRLEKNGLPFTGVRSTRAFILGDGSLIGWNRFGNTSEQVIKDAFKNNTGHLGIAVQIKNVAFTSLEFKGWAQSKFAKKTQPVSQANNSSAAGNDEEKAPEKKFNADVSGLSESDLYKLAHTEYLKGNCEKSVFYYGKLMNVSADYSIYKAQSDKAWQCRVTQIKEDSKLKSELAQIKENAKTGSYNNTSNYNSTTTNTDAVIKKAAADLADVITDISEIREANRQARIKESSQNQKDAQNSLDNIIAATQPKAAVEWAKYKQILELAKNRTDKGSLINDYNDKYGFFVVLDTIGVTENAQGDKYYSPKYWIISFDSSGYGRVYLYYLPHSGYNHKNLKKSEYKFDPDYYFSGGRFKNFFGNKECKVILQRITQSYADTLNLYNYDYKQDFINRTGLIYSLYDLTTYNKLQFLNCHTGSLNYLNCIAYNTDIKTSLLLELSRNFNNCFFDSRYSEFFDYKYGLDYSGLHGGKYIPTIFYSSATGLEGAGRLVTDLKQQYWDLNKKKWYTVKELNMSCVNYNIEKSGNAGFTLSMYDATLEKTIFHKAKMHFVRINEKLNSGLTNDLTSNKSIADDEATAEELYQKALNVPHAQNFTSDYYLKYDYLIRAGLKEHKEAIDQLEREAHKFYDIALSLNLNKTGSSPQLQLSYLKWSDSLFTVVSVLNKPYTLYKIYELNYFYLLNDEKAIFYYKQALNKRHEPAIADSIIYYNLNTPEQAIFYINKFLDPYKIGNDFGENKLLYILNDLIAKKNFEKAEQLLPTLSKEKYLQYGKLLCTEGKFEEAVEHYKKMILKGQYIDRDGYTKDETQNLYLELARHYYYGVGVQQNTEEARKFEKKYRRKAGRYGYLSEDLTIYGQDFYKYEFMPHPAALLKDKSALKWLALMYMTD